MNTETQERAGARPLFWLLLLVLVAVAAFAIYVQRHGGRLDQAMTSMQQSSGDAVTAAKVKGALALSSRVRAFDIDVDADGGAVTLRGQVPTQEVREMAGTIAAETQGVTSVRNELAVSEAARPDPELEAMATRVADLEIKAGVQEALLLEPAGLAGAVSVEVADGTVILSGNVPDAEHRYRAELAARRVPGVRTVENRLGVVAAAPAADADERLAKAVAFELYSTGAFELATLEVAAEGSTVRLGGTVRSAAEKLLAERVAGEVAGVERVVNALEVGAEATAGTTPPPPM